MQAGAFVAHRASAVHDLGGWSEWLVEDIAWCWKALSRGYRSGYASKQKRKLIAQLTPRGYLNRDVGGQEVESKHIWKRGRQVSLQESVQRLGL